MRRRTTAFFAVAAGVLAALAVSAAASATTTGLLAFSSNRSGQPEIYVSDADGGSRTTLGAQGSTPQFSPDGSRIAFASTRDGNSEIYVMNADGSGQTRLTFNPGYDSRPQWTGDGAHLVFTRILPPFNWEIFEMNADGSGQTNLTNSPAVEWGQSASPHGNKIVFTREDDGVGHLYVMNTTNGNLTQVTASSSYDEYPNWSPNGNEIVFDRNSGRGSDLWVVHTDGTGLRRLTNESDRAYFYGASWSPDGTTIAVTRCGLDASSPCALHTLSVDGSGDTDISTPKPPFLDTFSTGRFDSFWGSPFVTGSGAAISSANGELEVSVPSSASVDPNAGFLTLGVSSQCMVNGDFDAQADYRLLSWPSPSDVNLSLDTFPPDFSEVHGMFVFDPGFGTGISTHFPGPTNTFVSDPSLSGTLRLQRVGSTLTAYRLVGGAWSPLQSTPDSLLGQFVNLNVFSNVPPFSHPDVKVAFDNVRISGASFSCPSWWIDGPPDWQPLR